MRVAASGVVEAMQGSASLTAVQGGDQRHATVLYEL
jgi:hypothetical protein